MSIDKIAPGDETAEDRLPHSPESGDRIVDNTGSDVNVEKIRGVDELIDKVAVPMANAANPNMPTAKFSVDTGALLFPSLSTFVDEVN